MTTNLSRATGFIFTCIVSIALAIIVSAWWLIAAIVCLAIATCFWMQDRAYHTLRPRHTTGRPATVGRDFRLTRHPR